MFGLGLAIEFIISVNISLISSGKNESEIMKRGGLR